MKFIDNNGRLFGKISVIDVLVFVVALCLGAALYVKTTSMTHTGTTTTYDTITYTIVCHGVADFVEGQIRVGDRIFDYDNTTVGSLGEIIDIRYEAGTELTEFDDGTVCLAPVENSVNIILTIRGEGIISNGNYMLNRIYPLGVNANRNFCTQYAYMKGIVASIEK